MISVGVIGIGNAGSQVAARCKERLGIDVLAINSSEKDLQTIPDSVPKLLIGDSKGAGKERRAAKLFLKDSIKTIISEEKLAEIFDQEILFIVSSTGGGTGSGSAILLSNIVSEIYPATKVIVVGILPTLKEALSTQLNTMSYLEELYNTLEGATYMLYDNEKLSKLPSNTMMTTINDSIVNDIDVIRGTYQLPTAFSSIDEKDMLNVLTTPGRIVVAGLMDLSEKDLDGTNIDTLLIQQLKNNTHAELQRDKIVYRTGIISNLSDRLSEQYDSHIPEVQTFIGTPVEEFEHIVINSDRKLPNNVFLIAAGLSQVNDRIRKINDRVDEIQEAQKQLEDESELNATDFRKMSDGIVRRKAGEASGNVDLQGIFSKFDI
jgi:cell division GTPase FtsZ